MIYFLLAAFVAGSTASADEALILDCTAQSGTFSSLTRLYAPSSSVLLKIERQAVYIWRDSAWVAHPCVGESRDGQFCSIGPQRIWFKDSTELAPGAVEENEVDIDRRTGRFQFNNVLATPGLPPYIQSKSAAGTCTRAVEPPLPETAF